MHLLCISIHGMKRPIILILLFAGMVIFAQGQDVNLDEYTAEFNRTDATIYDLLNAVEAVRDQNLTGIGDFYENALRMLLYRLPNYRAPLERQAVQEAARVIIRGLAAEKQTSAAPYIWRIIQEFDIVHQQNDVIVMTEGLIALGQIGAKDYLSHIILRLDNINAEQTADLYARRRLQMVATAAISALQALQEPEGVRSVFFASIGWYDPDIKALAVAAFPQIMEDPSDIVAEIIRNPFNDPLVKQAAWQRLLESNAPESSISRVAAVALETSYTYVTPIGEFQRPLREMRLSSIDTIRRFGINYDDDGEGLVYAYLDRTYREAYNSPTPDFGTIMMVVTALSSIRSDEAVRLLTGYLREINIRRRSGPWGYTERDIMRYIIPALAVTGTQLPETMQLLSAIGRSSLYTEAEQSWAANALRALVK